MTDNPFAPPTAVVNDPAERPVPEGILKAIKHATIAALFSGSITLIVVLISISGTSIMGFTAWELVDVALIFGLAFGIYKRSRVCATLMFVYFVASKIYMMVQTGQPSGLLLAIVFGVLFFKGMIATFEYHNFLRQPMPGAGPHV